MIIPPHPACSHSRRELGAGSRRCRDCSHRCRCRHMDCRELHRHHSSWVDWGTGSGRQPRSHHRIRHFRLHHHRSHPFPAAGHSEHSGHSGRMRYGSPLRSVGKAVCERAVGKAVVSHKSRGFRIEMEMIQEKHKNISYNTQIK